LGKGGPTPRGEKKTKKIERESHPTREGRILGKEKGGINLGPRSKTKAGLVGKRSVKKTPSAPIRQAPRKKRVWRPEARSGYGEEGTPWEQRRCNLSLKNGYIAQSSVGETART